MTDRERIGLLSDIEQIDFRHLAELYESYRLDLSKKNRKKIFQEIEVLSFCRGEVSEKYRKRLCCLGEDYLMQGKVAIFLVAGGQGTRLGFNGPKGCYAISPVKNKTLFQLFAENIRALKNRYGKCPKWYIMTSCENSGETRSFFEKSNFFGLERDSICFLIQKQIPALDLNGRLIISRDKKIFKNPDGHGGAIRALFDSGALQEMAREGIDEIFYFQVDNPLAKIADPLFIGAHVEHNAEMSSKVVNKENADERVGIIGRVDGKLGCIEYSELSQKEAQERRSDGSLRFRSANIAIHMLNRNFVEKLNRDKNFRLPYHRAIKEIECLDVNGHLPRKIQGIKFELFIFDALGFAERSVSLEVPRNEEFSPVKNRTGADSPETARRAMINIHTKWLKSSVKLSSIPENLVVEVSPLYALDEEMFKEKFIEPPQISSPFYLE